jgi:hypothetical protein
VNTANNPLSTAHCNRSGFGLNRKLLPALAGAALVAGIALNWKWLAAAGALPLLALLPCAVMCVLHLCSGKGSPSKAGQPLGLPDRTGGDTDH